MARKNNTDEKVEPVLEEAPAEVEETKVALVNLGDLPCYVPLASGYYRLGAKESVEVPSADVTEETRQLDGRILIRNL